MLVPRMQVKYCKGEEERNAFLYTLYVSDLVGMYPRLYSIQHLSDVSCHGTDDAIDMGSELVAAVLYVVMVDDGRDEVK